MFRVCSQCRTRSGKQDSTPNAGGRGIDGVSGGVGQHDPREGSEALRAGHLKRSGAHM